MKQYKKVKVEYYKHSFGHFRFERDARGELKRLEEKYPKKTLQVVVEKRKKPQWKKYCVCEFIPFKKAKEGTRKVKLRVN